MNKQPVIHPISKNFEKLNQDIFETMFKLFEHIGVYWKNMDNSTPYRSELYVFMQNRINLYPIYQEYYKTAYTTINQMILEVGAENCYEIIFTDPYANLPPVDSNLSIVRQKVSNEFIDFQLSIGGFKSFGAKNYPGYIGGAFIPGEAVPYRTMENNNEI
ncbi:hypothetical protein ACM9HF_07845 [Colwellia sp. RE-S-Sl-9]